jgi:hypothetical protein
MLPLFSCIFLATQYFCATTAMAQATLIKDGTGRTLVYGEIQEDLADVAYSGDEYFKYDVFWSGRIKIGELFLQLIASEQCPDCFEIDASITSRGSIIDALYPIEDRHVTTIRGSERLPFHCEIWQKQGRNYTAHKTIVYNQQDFSLFKTKSGNDGEFFQFDGKVHNEFSAFFASRVMDLQKEKPIVVPTFGDEKRVEVVVVTLAEDLLQNTLLGDVRTLKVSPVLTFSGLYDKKGDTVIWYTSDECRVPVQIQSKLVIGSLTATLVEYDNPLCERYADFSTSFSLPSSTLATQTSADPR